MLMYAKGLDRSNEHLLRQRMSELGVRETELEERFVRSAGPGGQNLNKTSTCVVLVHRPSGQRVRCQATREQWANRLIARTLLLDKIEALRRRSAEAERALRERRRRQQRRPSVRARERTLADKSRRAETKQLRRRVEQWG